MGEHIVSNTRPVCRMLESGMRHYAESYRQHQSIQRAPTPSDILVRDLLKRVGLQTVKYGVELGCEAEAAKVRMGHAATMIKVGK